MQRPAGGQCPKSQGEPTVLGSSGQQQQQAAQAAGDSIAGPESPQPKQHRRTPARAAAPAAAAALGAQQAAVVEGMRGMIGVYPDVDPAARRFTGGASGIPWGHGGSGCVWKECLRPLGGGVRLPGGGDSSPDASAASAGSDAPLASFDSVDACPCDSAAPAAPVARRTWGMAFPVPTIPCACCRLQRAFWRNPGTGSPPCGL